MKRGGRLLGDRQVVFTWVDPGDVLRSADERGGAVVFEAPDVSRIVRGKAPRLPRVKVRGGAAEPRSMGLPFGLRRVQGRLTCWSCAQDFDEGELVRARPGHVTCPGCGAHIPFAE
jgi:hypothetical protein